MRDHSSAEFARAALALAMCAGLAACATSPQRLTATSASPAQSLAASSASPAPRLAQSREMPLGAPVEAPVGFVSLCMRSPVDCVHTDTPQARASAVLQAQTLARARWQRVMELAASRGQIEAAPPAPASIGAPAGTGAAPAPAPEPAPTSAAAPAEASLLFASTTTAAAPAASNDRKIALDPATWTRLRQINAYVNRAIRPASDLDVYGVRDWWVAPLSSGLAPYGDCKDYVLEKRRELIGAGLPPRALSIALVRTAWGESHAVLVVATSAGDLVLDNLSGEIKPWDRAPYAWEARQSAADPLLWLAVHDKFAPPPERTVVLAQAELKPSLGR